MNNYRADLYDTNGVQQASLVGIAEGGFQRISYRRYLNGKSLATLVIHGEEALLSVIGRNWLVSISRKVSGKWSRVFFGLLTEINWSYTDKPVAELVFESPISLLDKRVIAYPASTINRTQFINKPAETIMNTIVKYNATSSGTTADGRVRNAVSGYPYNRLTVEADGAGGDNLTIYCTWQSVYQQLRIIADMTGDDFSIEWVSSTEWEWQYHEGGIGTDLSAALLFALERHNLGSPNYRLDYKDYCTVGIVAGQGEADDREIEIVLADDHTVDEDTEVFIDARDIEVGDTLGLQTRGSEKLSEYLVKETFTFSVLQVPNAVYGDDYDLGDLVMVRNPATGEDAKMKVAGDSVVWSEDGREDIELDLEAA